MELFEDRNDEARMNALYMAFRNKSVNPEGWVNKMNTWISVINSYCKKYRKVSFTQRDIEIAFERNHLKPQCLELVIGEMSRQSMLIRRTDFESSLSSWTAWGISTFVKKPVSWGWSMVSRSIFGASEPAPVEYIHEDAFKEVATLILEKFVNIANSGSMGVVQEVRSFHNKCLDLCPDFDVFKLILSHLNSQGKVALFYEAGQNYVKLLGIKSINTDKSQPPVTKVDLGVVKLQNALEQVMEEIDIHEEEMENLRKEAGVLLKEGKKSKAKGLLAKKQRIEKSLQQKIKAAENIEGMLQQLENSVTNQGVMQALKAGVQAHKAAASGGMSVDKIDETLNEIEDAFEEQNEIAEVMGRGIGFNSNMDDADLEYELEMLEELENLEEKSKEIKEKSFDGSKLPEVPQSEIGDFSTDDISMVTTTTTATTSLPTLTKQTAN